MAFDSLLSQFKLKKGDDSKESKDSKNTAPAEQSAAESTPEPVAQPAPAAPQAEPTSAPASPPPPPPPIIDTKVDPATATAALRAFIAKTEIKAPAAQTTTVDPNAAAARAAIQAFITKTEVKRPTGVTTTTDPNAAASRAAISKFLGAQLGQGPPPPPFGSVPLQPSNKGHGGHGHGGHGAKPSHGAPSKEVIPPTMCSKCSQMPASVCGSCAAAASAAASAQKSAADAAYQAALAELSGAPKPAPAPAAAPAPAPAAPSSPAAPAAVNFAWTKYVFTVESAVRMGDAFLADSLLNLLLDFATASNADASTKARLKSQQARVRIEQKQFPQGEEILLEALKSLEGTPAARSVGAAYCLHALAYSYFLQKKLEAHEIAFRKAIMIADECFRADDPELKMFKQRFS